jgi:hypothetical protein
MSATKNYLADLESTVQDVDQTTYSASSALCMLANLAWGSSTVQPLWAPDAEWLEETETELKFMLNCLAELKMARSCMDAQGDDVTVNNDHRAAHGHEVM